MLDICYLILLYKFHYTTEPRAMFWIIKMTKTIKVAIENKSNNNHNHNRVLDDVWVRSKVWGKPEDDNKGKKVICFRC